MKTASSAEPLLRVANLVVGYRAGPVLPALTFEVQAQQFWAIVGRNGSGKTTLMRTLLGLLPRLGGRLLWARGVKIGYIPQRSQVDLTVPARVIDIVRGGCERGWTFAQPMWRRAWRPRIARVLQEVECASLTTQRFATLSEGQKQRVLLARALVADPAMLVLDEPTSAMDDASERGIFDLLDNIRRARSLGIMVVGHHLSVLASRASHLAVLDGNEQLAALGALPHVARLPAVQARYGRLFVDAAGARSERLAGG